MPPVHCVKVGLVETRLYYLHLTNHPRSAICYFTLKGSREELCHCVKLLLFSEKATHGRFRVKNPVQTGSMINISKV